MSSSDPRTFEGSAEPAAPPSGGTPTNGRCDNSEHASKSSAESAAPPHEQNGSTTGERNQVDRAEEMVDRIAETVAGATSRWGRGIVRLFSRVREEAEDVWGEAQSIRRGDQS